MTFARVPNQRNADLHYFTEVTAGVAPTTEAVERVRFTTMTVQPQSTEDVIEEAGELFPVDIAEHSISYSGTVSMLFRHGDINPLLKAALRDSAGMPSEVTQAPIVSFINSVADLDGVSKPALKVVGSNGGFDALKAASSQALCGGLWVRISDSATAGNDSATIGPKLVTPGNPRDSGADTLLSLDPRSFNATSGWGGAADTWAAEDTLDTISVAIGAAAVPYNAPATGLGTYTLIGRYTDVSTSMYFALKGVIFGAPTLGWNARGALTLDFPYIAYDRVPVSDTTITSGSHDDSTLGVIAPRGGSGVSRFAIVTDTQVVILDGDEIQGPTTAMGGGATFINDTIGGTTPAGWVLDPMTANWGFNYLLKGGATEKAEALEAMAHKDTRERATLFVEFTDVDGNVFSFTFHEANVKTAVIGTIGGGSGPSAGTFAATVCKRPPNGAGNTWPGVSYQVWSAS